MGGHDDPADRDVVRSVLAGDGDRFTLLVRRYRGPLLHLAANRLGDVDAAEDAVQDAFVAAFKSLHTYRPEFSFRTWLWTILLNQCKRHGTRLARLPAQPSLNEPARLVTGSTAETTPDQSAMQAERNELLRDLLGELSDHQADAVRLRFFGQLKYREIADTLECSLSAAKKWVREGLETISNTLRERNLVDAVHPGDNHEDSIKL